jgi:polyisoprenoid-binding protein YceI
MRTLALVLLALSATGAGAHRQSHARQARPQATTERVAAARESAAANSAARAAAQSAPAVGASSFRIDAARSSFTVRAFAGGVLWFKGHDHLLRVRDFSGEVQFAPGGPQAARLRLRVRADSLEETRDVFTEQQKQIINRELREIVLEADKYPEITFESTGVRAEPLGGGRLKAVVEGDLTLHGVTRRVHIPAEVTAAGGELRARGEFSLSRGDFKVKATSAFHGTVRVRDKLRFTFDIVARAGR